jgi:hypothetical protein
MRCILKRIALVLLLLSRAAAAQMMDMNTQGPPGLRLPHGREGSGTSWAPDDTPVFAQHFMEVAAIYRHALLGGFGLELYAAPSGEPALGPTAFMHRASAMLDPFPPIGHHWQDSTHISFPVLTAGLYNETVKLEGSLFHGREPDEDRWDFDLGGLDSWSSRLSVNPASSLSFQVSYGYLHSPEAARPEQSEHRFTASGHYSAPFGDGGSLSLSLVYGRDISANSTDSVLGEAQLDLDGVDVPFARLEYVVKPAEELVVPGGANYGVGLAVLGYARRLPAVGPVVPLLGAALDLGLVPSGLVPFYGSRAPLGAFVFLGLQPARMPH